MNKISRVLAAGIALGLGLVVARGAHADAHPNLQRGFAAESFAVGDLDHVNLFNGNLVISIPLGQEYVVSPTLSYQFRLVYNSNVWEHLSATCGTNSTVRSVPNPANTAGLGWTVSLGHLWRPGDIKLAPGSLLANRFQYIGADGAEHVFFDRLRNEDTPQANVFYTRDGSFLRLLTAGAPRYEIQFPSGQRHFFLWREEESGAGARLDEIRDRFSGNVKFDYFSGFWTAKDSTGRSHTVEIEAGNGEQLGRIKKLSLATFGGALTPYAFTYTNPSVSRQPPHQACNNDFPNPAPQSLLQSVTLPDTSTYVMTGYGGAFGRLSRMRLPLGGEIAWEYGVYGLPAGDCVEGARLGECGYPRQEARTRAQGVSKRSVFLDSGSNAVGTWIYSDYLLDGSDGKTIVEAVRGVLQVETGVFTENYFSAYTGFAPLSGLVAEEYGLPYSRQQGWQDPAGTLSTAFRSSRTYQCTAGLQTTTNCLLQRSTWLRYDQDAVPAGNGDPEEKASFTNRRAAAERTLHVDDRQLVSKVAGQAIYADRYVAVDYSDYDKYGRFRQMAYDDNFERRTTRKETTDWEAPDLDLVDGWVLTRYRQRKQEQGSSQQVQEFDFDAKTGFLNCERRWAGTASRSGADVLVTYRDANAEGFEVDGFVSQESWYGGDDTHSGSGTERPAPTATLCGTPPGSPSPPALYTYAHSYSSGVRSKTTVPAVDNLNLLDLTIDRNTGMASSARDTGGVQTSFTYDDSGRLKTATRTGEAVVENTYNLAARPPAMLTRVGASASPLEEEKWTFDGFGRIVIHGVRHPGSSPSPPQWDEVKTEYNGVGWRTKVTDRGSSAGTTFDYYDVAANAPLDRFEVYGRPKRITRADGSVTELAYRGHSLVERSTRVWNGAAEEFANTKEWYDSRGQLWQLQEPSLAGATAGTFNRTRTRYQYDVAGRLVMVRHNAGETGPSRGFRYDGRGFLTREVHPENGATNYWYDAKGNVVQKVTADSSTVRSLYDAAGRLTSVYSPQKPLREFEYGTAAGAARGKLIAATARNWRGGAADCTDFRVRHDYTYDTSGRLQVKTTSLAQQVGTGSPLNLEQWEQRYNYDPAGRIQTLEYPNCSGGTCTSSPLSVTTNYSFGRPTAVVESGSPSQFASPIAYHSSGLLASIQHANGVVYNEGPDPSGIARPGSIEAKRGTESRWSLESYKYDDAGNIISIGPGVSASTRKFAYDLRSRLISATAPELFSDNRREYTYDDFGNLIKVGNGTGSGDVFYTTNTATNQITAAAYTKAGSMLGYQGHSFTWDRFQQAKTTSTGSEAWTHTYDTDGERVWSWRTAGAPRIDTYALRGPDGKVLRDFKREAGTLTWEDYIYREGQALASRKSDGTVQHFDLDHLGSVRLITDATGATVSKHNFWPYGEEYTSAAGGQQMKFTGHERDLGVLGSNADDLDYMHARYYRPLWGRFLTVDPAVESVVLSEPSSWNRYSYAANNPVLYLDPDGRVIFTSPEAAFAFVEANEYLSKSPVAKAVMAELTALKGAHEPRLVLLEEGVSSFVHQTNIIYWNPKSGIDVSGQNGEAGTGGTWVQSPALVLLHESAHGVQHNNNPAQFATDHATADAQYDRKEERRVVTTVETAAARELGEPTRKTHDGRVAPYSPQKQTPLTHAKRNTPRR